jgi:hypothetical protein
MVGRETRALQATFNYAIPTEKLCSLTQQTTTHLGIFLQIHGSSTFLLESSETEVGIYRGEVKASAYIYLPSTETELYEK